MYDFYTAQIAACNTEIQRQFSVMKPHWTNRAGQAFRQAAITMARSPSAFGAYYRRKRAQAGPLFAQVATAHRIARTVYYLLKHHVQDHDIGAETYALKQREVIALRRKAAKLGFSLTSSEVSPPT